MSTIEKIDNNVEKNLGEKEYCGENSHKSNKHLIGTSYACNNQQTSHEENIY